MVFRWFFIFIFLWGSQVVAKGNAFRGKEMAKACATCHGLNGVGKDPLWPNIGGQNKEYLILQLKAFREKKRYSPLMSPNVVNLTDQDIEDLAAYYSGLK